MTVEMTLIAGRQQYLISLKSGVKQKVVQKVTAHICWHSHAKIVSSDHHVVYSRITSSLRLFL
jgi:hypothetical protein